MTSRHRAWRSPGGPALAAAPWIIIFSGLIALAALLALTLWKGFAEDSSRPGASGPIGAGDQFPPPLPSSQTALPVAERQTSVPASGQGGEAGPGPTAGTSTGADTGTGSGTGPAGPTGATRPGGGTTTPAPAATSTSAPAKAVARNAFSVLQAESFDARSGLTVVACDEGGKAISTIADGDWARYDNVDFGSSKPIDFVARVASGLSGGGSGLVQVRLGSPSSTPIGDFAIDNTGGWQTWRSVPGNVTGPTGVHTVYLTFTSAQPADFVAVNWFTFRH
jgi:hypothetical protein